MPYENNEEQRSEKKELKKDEDENDVDDKNDDKKEIPDRNKNDRDLNFSYHHQSGAVHIVDNIGNFSRSSTVSSKSGSDFFWNNDVDASEISKKEKNIEDEFCKDKKIFQLRQYTDVNAMRCSHDFSSSSIIENKHDNSKEIRNTDISKEEEIARENISLVKEIETIRKTEEKQYRSFERISTPFKNGNLEYREPTIRTTPLTVLTHGGARCVERIIINEETLKKIVVPTASSDSASNSSRSKKDETSNTFNNYSNLDGACNDNKLPLELDSHVVNQNVNNGVRAKQKAESTSRNVFIKTKRMIFSTFRRASHERDIDESNSNRVERPKSKSKSKSRSASPRTSRHETVPRTPLSLPWILRSSSKEPEKKKYHRRTCSGEDRVVQNNKIITEKEGKKISIENVEISSNTRDEEINKEIAYVEEKKVIEKKDEENKKVYRNPIDDGYEEIIVRETEQDHRLSAVPIFGIQEEDETERSMITEDKLPSDLVHKLQILSNAAAKRDGRIGSCIATTTTESRSSRIQRAKEGFLSRRGGPLCQSMLEPLTPVISNQKDNPLSMDDHKDLTLNIENRNCEDINRDFTAECPIQSSSVSQSATFSQNSNSKSDLVKSASAGMINVDPDTFGRLASNRGCESLPRTISKRRDSDGPLARIVNKLRISKLMRGKDNEDGNMSTISTLCRQSLLIDVRPDLEESHENENRTDEDENENSKEYR